MKTTVENQHRCESQQAYKILLALEKEAKAMKKGAKGDSEGEADYRPLSWPVTLLNIARGLIESAESIAYWRHRYNSEYPQWNTAELAAEIEKDRTNLDEARKRIEEIFTHRIF